MQQHHERHNLYREIHKGIRAMLSQALLNCGRADWLDAQDCALSLAEVRGTAAFCAGHVEHENGFIHPAMEARAPASAARIAAEHVDHLHEIDSLLRAADTVEQAAGPARIAAGEALYQQLALFVADNFEHMHVEETAHNAVLWACYSDAELEALHHELVGSLSPHESQQSLQWMLPYSSHAARAGILGGMRAMAPAFVYEGTLAMLRPQLSPRDLAKLEAALAPVELQAA